MATETLPSDITESVRSFVVPADFSIREIDGHRSARAALVPTNNVPLTAQAPLNGEKPPIQRGLSDIPTVAAPLKLATHPADDPRLGPVLGKFVGTFQGAGMNTIFRPNNNFKKENLHQDNLLEINLTVETLQFMESNVLGKVPNRGFKGQRDVFLTGIPYQQTVSDRLNPISGKADLPNKKIDLHFEQGLLLRTPPTNNTSTPTISRLGSIPHGTTINAQAFEPKTTKAKDGKPDIPTVRILPFQIGKDQDTAGADKFPKGNPFKTAMENADATNTLISRNAKTGDPEPAIDESKEGERIVRKPEKLQSFIDNNTITIESLNNPNKFLKDINAKKTFGDVFEFKVETDNKALPGGGTANINFLDTVTGGGGNARAARMSCTYWVSTVKHDVTIPAGDYSLDATNDDPVFFANDDTAEGVPVPKFQVQVRRKIDKPVTIQVSSTQIQYSQDVTLDFGGLSWPHISVATLVPALPILVPAGDAALAKLPK